MLTEGFRGPQGWITDDFLASDDTHQLDMIIDLVIPWYFGFFVSWQEAAGTSQCEIHWVTYEDMINDFHKTIAKVLEFCGNVADHDVIYQAICQAKTMNTRMNQGVVGRGKRVLTEEHTERIAGFAGHYRSIDFSLIGIRKNRYPR